MDQDYRILIVDDDLDTLDGHIRLLLSQGYKVVTAETGKTCLTAVIENRPDLILLDVILPDIDGYEVCKQIKSVMNDKAPYIVLFSAQETDVESQIKGLEIGADDYLTKPINRKELLARVNAIVRLMKAEREREKFKIMLAQSQKMEAIGTLAGGIAHDFNNILSIILGNTEFIMTDIPSDNPIYEPLENTKSAALRAKSLVKQILDFSRKSNPNRINLRFHDVIKKSVKFMQATLPTTIKIKEQFSDNEDHILSNETQIEQVIINLCNNAAYAMGYKGGTLTVGLESITVSKENTSYHHEIKPGEYVKLSVSDTGCGINPDIRDKIFDPYFTTKPTGKGSGLGLSVVYGIVKSHEGEIFFHSEVGKGTTFSVYFPVAERKYRKEYNTPDDLPRGNERILFIDDQDMVVSMAELMLKYLGYKVTCETMPLKALELFRNHPESIDLVITDMTMPEMTGDKLAKEFMKIRQDIPVILCTGHSDFIDEKRSNEIGIRAFITKPVEMKDLAKIIRNVLNKERNLPT